MTFDSRESSQQDGEPINLYFFKYGEPDECYFAYTDAEQAVVQDIGIGFTVTFEPIAIDRDAITSSGTLDKSTLEIHLPNTEAICDLYRFVPPSEVTQLTIFEGHADDAAVNAVWVGRVLGAESQGNEKVFTCEPVQTSLRRVGLRRNWQLGCPHLLYGPRCKADIGLATTQTTVQAVNGPLVLVPDGWAGGADLTKFQGGLAYWLRADDTRLERRTILRFSSAFEAVLSGSVLDSLLPGDLINFALGCDHTEGDCLNLHNNINNYGGQSKIPTDNPTGVKNSYY